MYTVYLIWNVNSLLITITNIAILYCMEEFLGSQSLDCNVEKISNAESRKHEYTNDFWRFLVIRFKYYLKYGYLPIEKFEMCWSLYAYRWVTHFSYLVIYDSRASSASSFEIKFNFFIGKVLPGISQPPKTFAT